jgi:hypothetical protein
MKTIIYLEHELETVTSLNNKLLEIKHLKIKYFDEHKRVLAIEEKLINWKLEKLVRGES